MQGFGVVGDVIAKFPAGKFQQVIEMRVAFFLGNVGDSGHPLKFRQGVRPVIGFHGPAIAVDPDTVHAVVAYFLQLWNEQTVGVRAPKGYFFGIGLAAGVQSRPVRVQFHRPVVPNAGIVHI